MDNRRETYDGILTKQNDPLEIRAGSEQGLLTGYASLYWVVDSYAEVTAPGSFAETIQQRGPAGEDRIHLRYEHQTTIGTHRKMVEDDTGLLIEGHVSDDGMDGTRVRRHLADGVHYGLSIGFRREADRTAEDSDPLDFSSAPAWVQSLPRNEIRVLTRNKLYEDSVVSFPAVDPATVDSYRSSTFDMAVLVAAMKAGDLTDDMKQQILNLLNESPSEGSRANGETPDAERLPKADSEMLGETPDVDRLTHAVKRNREAYLSVVLADLRQRGIGVPM